MGHKAEASRACPLCGGARVFEFLRAPDRFHLRHEVYRLLRCSSCSCTWLDDPPQPEEMSYHYDEMYHAVISSVGETRGSEGWQKQRKIVSELKGAGTLLDVGCSSGAFLDTLKEGPWNLYGIEIDPQQAKRAQEMTGAQIFTGDPFDAPFPPESFDIVTCFHVLEHLDRPQERIEKIFNWLKPGGILYLGLPNVDSWEARLFGSYWFGLELPRHLYHYSPRSLRKLVSLAGFHELWLETSSSYSVHSIRYVFDDAVQKLGFSRAPLAAWKIPGLPLRVIRKAYRVTLGLSFTKISELAGAAANIEAVFQKERITFSMAG